jgi:hypothetical protein
MEMTFPLTQTERRLHLAGSAACMLLRLGVVYIGYHGGDFCLAEMYCSCEHAAHNHRVPLAA